MARILICEPHPDLRALLEVVVRRAGHEPVGHGELTSGDDAPAVLILEPACADSLAAATGLKARLEDLAIICTSILPPSAETTVLGPVAYLVKPFHLDELEAAIASAVAA